MENMFAVWVCKEEDSGWRRDEWYPWAACTTGTELSASWACNETPALRRTINVYLFHFLDIPGNPESSARIVSKETQRRHLGEEYGSQFDDCDVGCQL